MCSEMPPAVSVVMPVYKPDFLAPAIESVLAQTMGCFELILINDGSPHKRTDEIASAFAAKDSRVRYLRQDNKGVAAARNAGVAAACAPFIMLMDDDDISLPERMGCQLRFLKSHPRIAAVNCSHLCIGKNGEVISGGNPRNFFESVIQQTPPHISNLPLVADGAWCMFRKTAYDEIGGMRAFFYSSEITDFCLRLEEKFAVAAIPETLYHYRVHNNQSHLGRNPDVFLYECAARYSAHCRREGKPDAVDGAASLEAVLVRAAVDGFLSLRMLRKTAKRCLLQNKYGSLRALLAAKSPKGGGLKLPLKLAYWSLVNNRLGFWFFRGDNKRGNNGMVTVITRRLFFWLLRQLRPGRFAHRLLPSRLQNKVMQARKRAIAENLRIAGEQPAGNMRGKIIAYIFAGRRDRMEILLGYLDKLLGQGQIDAMHIWNLARTDSDRKWARGLANKKGYSVMEFIPGDWTGIFKRPRRTHTDHLFWPYAHNYYAQKCYDGCGLVKVDDDIVFADTPRFGVFRAALLRLASGECDNCHMISANVVNNPVFDCLHQREGIIPQSVATFPSARLETRQQEEDYYQHGKKSQAVHEFFLDNPRRFLREGAGNAVLNPEHRLKINFIGLTNRILPIPDGDNDEQSFFALPPEKKKGITAIRGFTVAHLSFVCQPEQNDAELIRKYRELAKRAPFAPESGK